MRLLSVNVSLPREVEWRGRPVLTSIFKQPVAGRRLVRRLNVDGDAQADLMAHGGEHRAVFVYQRESYEHWARELSREDLTPGRFGENFTVDGMADGEVCVGDRYRIGTAVFEVTQPRVTCFKVGMALEEPRMPALLYAHGRPGFYFRVIEEGEVEPGDAIESVLAGPGRVSVREANAMLYRGEHTAEGLRRALAIPALSEGWRGSFTELLERHEHGDTRAPAWQGVRPFRVAAVRQESADVRSFDLEPADGGDLPAYLPGQFVTLRLEPPGSPPLLRTYSLATRPGAARWRIGVKREGAGSRYLHDCVAEGDIVQVGAPRGAFTLAADGSAPVVLVSAGVGVTPVLAMLDALADAGGDRQVWWLHGARSAAEHSFAAAAAALVERLPGAHAHVRYSGAAAGDGGFDAPGRIDAAALAELDPPAEADYYLCGPAAFMRSLVGALTDRGVAPERVHREVFGPEPRPDGVDPHPPAGEPGAGPDVSFARSGLTVAWDDRYASLLELAEACDVPADWSCRTGVCHRCESGLVEGEVDYDPLPLDDPAPGSLLLCSTRPRTAVAIDL